MEYTPAELKCLLFEAEEEVDPYFQPLHFYQHPPTIVAQIVEEVEDVSKRNGKRRRRLTRRVQQLTTAAEITGIAVGTVVVGVPAAFIIGGTVLAAELVRERSKQINSKLTLKE